jgi:hypothetical protein
MEQLVIDGANYEAETGERLIGSRFPVSNRFAVGQLRC